MQIDLTQDKNLADIVGKLKNHFQPLKIYLFGSRAKGTETSASDYDLFLILKHSDKRMIDRMIDRMIEASDLLWGRTVPVDIFVYTESEFNEYKNEFSSIAYTVANEGVEI